MTFQAWLQQAIARLAESDSPRRDAEILLGHVTGRARTWILAFGETTLSADEATTLEALLQRRQRGDHGEGHRYHGREWRLLADWRTRRR